MIDFAFSALALALVLVVPNVAIVYVAIALLGFFAAGGALQTGLVVRQNYCPGPKGRNTGMYMTFMGVGATFLPFIVGAMTTAMGETGALYTMMGPAARSRLSLACYSASTWQFSLSPCSATASTARWTKANATSRN